MKTLGAPRWSALWRRTGAGPNGEAVAPTVLATMATTARNASAGIARLGRTTRRPVRWAYRTGLSTTTYDTNATANVAASRSARSLVPVRWTCGYDIHT